MNGEMGTDVLDLPLITMPSVDRCQGAGYLPVVICSLRIGVEREEERETLKESRPQGSGRLRGRAGVQAGTGGRKLARYSVGGTPT